MSMSYDEIIESPSPYFTCHPFPEASVPLRVDLSHIRFRVPKHHLSRLQAEACSNRRSEVMA